MNDSSVFQNSSGQINYQAGRYADPNAAPPYMNRSEQAGQGNSYQSGWHTQGSNPIEADILQQELHQPAQYSQQYGQYLQDDGQMQQNTQQNFQPNFQRNFRQDQPMGSQADMSHGRQFGALEIMLVHAVLNNHINGINHFEIYREYIKDQNLMQILDNQLDHMYNSYKNIVNYLHATGGGQAVPYRVPKSAGVKYGLRQPSPVQPNVNMNEMNDSDVASGMMECAKASASLCTTAALECADYNLRTMMLDCAVSCVNRAYEIFQYMNQAGMYQVPTLAQETTETMTNLYQAGTAPTM